jgi:hypothetical protein
LAIADIGTGKAFVLYCDIFFMNNYVNIIVMQPKMKADKKKGGAPPSASTGGKVS